MESKKRKTVDDISFVTPSGYSFDPLSMTEKVKERIYNTADWLLENDDRINEFGEAVICAFIMFLADNEGEIPISPDELN